MAQGHLLLILHAHLPYVRHPEFDRFLLHNPEWSGEVSSVAVGPGGSLYVFHKDGTANGNMGGHKIKVYNRGGVPNRFLLRTN